MLCVIGDLIVVPHLVLECLFCLVPKDLAVRVSEAGKGEGVDLARRPDAVKIWSVASDDCVDRRAESA